MVLNFIAALLAPMFLTASDSDIAFARMAAIETINAYRARNHADLLAAAQIIACGLSALGSLGLSMADDLSLPMILRLRGNANALNRSAEQNRRAIRKSPPGNATDAPTGPGDAVYAVYEATVLPNPAQTRQPVAAVCLSKTPLAAEPTPIPLPTAGLPLLTDQEKKAMWAAGMTNVAQEFTASLPHIPRNQRKLVSRRAAALSSCANQLLSGEVPPPLKAGDLRAMIERTVR
jgi:hypothetical protein